MKFDQHCCGACKAINEGFDKGDVEVADFQRCDHREQCEYKIAKSRHDKLDNLDDTFIEEIRQRHGDDAIPEIR